MRLTGDRRGVIGTGLALAAMLGALAVGCAERDTVEAAKTDQLVVCAGIAPIQDMVARIAGPRMRVIGLLSAGQSPHTFEPAARQIAEVSDARALFIIGMPFERRIVEKLKGAAPDLRVVDLQAGVPLLHFTAPHHHHDGHGHDHSQCNHASGEIDPHVWMNPRILRAQVPRICATLIELDPAGRAEYERNRDALVGELDALDAELRAKLAPYAGRAFYAFHPAFGYFADGYGLRQLAIESEGKQPAARGLGALVTQARAEGVKLILVQPEFDRRNAQTIAEEIGARVAVVNPLADDYIAELRALGDQLAASWETHQEEQAEPAPPATEAGAP
jgi:zinc transport system substrate-binding protein